MASDKPFHVVTPLRVSGPLSKLAGTKVYLKLENTQPTCSFKIRGIGNFCKSWAGKHCMQFVSASAGNAGLATAYCARELGIPATIFVPQCTPAFTVEAMEDEGAVVCIKQTLEECQNTAKEMVKRCCNSTYVPPFDDPLIWEGHKTMVTEMKEQMGESTPGAIVLSVGGGGMLCGVIQGLREVGWDQVPIIAMETRGAHSLNASLEEKKLVTLPEITSVATTLGAATVAEEALKLAQEHPVISQVVDDCDAVAAVAKFLDDERMLVEPACGASLAAVYSEVIKMLQKDGKLPSELESIVIIVCGGNNITMEELERLKEQVSADNGMGDLLECELALATFNNPCNLFAATLQKSMGACAH
ncbi:L-serine dehydratase/L-threonine deaminase-like [Zootoca vivipara]|uniref:L-serine dehydratase/L-threonine deaminase-like n=1 Tax=Zootoca vivipara TaxID=8524 RepID=UPI00293C0EAC|nr:L-serine dehydratase/L-threonine deaminase-like [Zootoca vivipara]